MGQKTITDAYSRSFLLLPRCRGRYSARWPTHRRGGRGTFFTRQARLRISQARHSILPSPGGINAHDVDYVVFYERPFRKLDRLLVSVLQTYPRSWKVFRESMIGWMLDKLWVASTLQSELGISRDKILFSEHHLSHAASSFFCSPFEEAAILTVDGVGEWATAATGWGKDSQLQLTKQIDFLILLVCFTAHLLRSWDSKSTRASTRSWAWLLMGRHAMWTKCGRS